VRNPFRLVWAPIVLALAACSASNAAGGGMGGAGGTAGAGGPEAPGGAGGVADPPRPIAFPTFDLELRSQLWWSNYDDGLLPASYELVFLERASACEAADGLRVGDGEGWVSFHLVGPAVGTCDVRGRYADWSTQGRPPPGCHALYAGAGVVGGPSHAAPGGTVRIDRLDASVIAGELRLLVPEQPIQNLGCWYYSFSTGDEHYFDHGGCDCTGPGGDFTCESAGGHDVDCCDDDIPPVEVVFPFEATRCPNGGGCATEPCVPYLVGSCRPDAVPPASCQEACADYARICRDGLGCTEEECAEQHQCDLPTCRATCDHLAGADPLVSLSFACLEVSNTCDEWAACISACGAG
jgi:hypothetical protein